MSAVSGRGRFDRDQQESPNYRITELERRLDKVIQYGTIEETNDDDHSYRVRIGKKKDDSASSSTATGGSSGTDDPGAGYLTTWLKHYVPAADDNSVAHEPIAKGAQVTVFAPSGDPAAQAFIMPGMYQKKYPAWSKDPKVKGRQYKDKAQSSYNVETGEKITTAKKKRTVQVGKHTHTIDADGTHTMLIGGKEKVDGSGKSTLDKDADGATEDAKKTKVIHHPNGVVEWALGDKMTALWNDGKINFKLGEKMLAEMLEGSIKFNAGTSKGEVQILENAVHMLMGGGASKISLFADIAKMVTGGGANSVTLAGGAITMKNAGGGSIGLSVDGTALLNSLFG